MNGRERRNKLIQMLSESSTPLSGKELSRKIRRKQTGDRAGYGTSAGTGP